MILSHLADPSFWQLLVFESDMAGCLGPQDGDLLKVDNEDATLFRNGLLHLAFTAHGTI